MRGSRGFVYAAGISWWNFVSRTLKWAAGSFIFCETAVFREVGGFTERLYAPRKKSICSAVSSASHKKRHRSIVILHRHPLLTSARKAHLYTIRELLRFWARTVLSGGRTFRNREELSLERWAAMKTAIGVPTAAEFAPAFEYVARVRQVADPLGELSVQRARFLARLSPLTEEQAQFRYAPDKWSVKDLLGHLCDAERVFAYRLLRIGRGDITPLPGFEETDYARAAGAHRAVQ